MIPGSGWAWVAALASGLTVWWLLPPLGLPRLRSAPERSGADALRASVPAVCDLLSVCLDAGRPPRTALRVVLGVVDGPAAEALGAVQARIDLGVDEAEAWGGLTAVAGYREVGRDLARSVRSGLGLSDLLRQHAADARADRASRALVRARAAGVRSVVPLMLCFLPAFMLLGVVPLFGALVVQLLP